MQKKKLIIFGINSFAEVAYEYFKYDSEYEVEAFAATKNFINGNYFLNLPVVDFEGIEDKYKPNEYAFFIAVAYSKLNRTRTYFMEKVKDKGYALASYVSSKANLWKNVNIGEHCFILEQNNLQPYVSIGNNVILWSGNHIGHHSIIEDNCFISSHVVISGGCKIGKNCFLGVNSTISDGVIVEKDTWIGPTSNIQNSLDGGFMYRENSVKESKIKSQRFFKFDI